MKVLVSAYACEPEKGSEPEVGWQWVRQIARFAETWVITRANNRAAIESTLAGNPMPNLHFEYFDYPNWAKFWKRGEKGIQLYYLLWQLGVIGLALRLQRQIHFDIVHHVTMVCDWKPPGLALVPGKFIWGPIGSNPYTPRAFYRELGLPVQMKNLLRYVLRKTTSVRDPIAAYAREKSSRIIAINSETANMLPKAIRNKTVIIPQNAIERGEIEERADPVRTPKCFSVVTVGQLLYIKGQALGLEAFAKHCLRYPTSRLTIIGDGSLRGYLKDKAKALGIENSVDFRGQIPRRDVLRIYKAFDVFLFPTFEGAGIAALEAMAKGLPVVCLDFGGPADYITEECGIKVRVTSPEQVATDLASGLDRLASDKELYRALSVGALRRIQEHYLWDHVGDRLKAVYHDVVAS